MRKISTSIKRQSIETKIAEIEALWNRDVTPPLTLSTGWCQTQNAEFRNPTTDICTSINYRIQLGVWYGQWRALHDLLGSPYGYV